jgi:hypothetical protein
MAMVYYVGRSIDVGLIPGLAAAVYTFPALQYLSGTGSFCK